MPVEPDSKFFIVGVGASAGGLEALGALLKNLALDAMALVVVQHLAPKYESVLPDLLARVSNVRVRSVEDRMKVEPNNVYVIPPNFDLTIVDGVLHLLPPPDGRGVRLPIDSFFRSLAQDQGARAVGVVLSGTGSDGTFGLKAIKEAGGITFAQDPASAKYDGMPRSAIDAGWVDLSLPAEEIASELMNFGSHSYLARPHIPSQETREGMGKLVLLMRSAFGNDLTYYKPSTIDRRTERRMALHKLERLDDYVKLVQSNPEELRNLYQDMLISVTSFFRDFDPFDAFKTKVLPAIMEHKEVGDQIRIWVPACASGEEAYSFAMCLVEHLEDKIQDYRIQIFGTDVDEVSIARARRGVYPQNIALDVSPERLHRFFVKRENEYQVSRRIRDMVVFSVQNVLRDAPFSRLDAASCRNLLIYLQPAAQKKVLKILHYALNPTGFLMLGNSETVGDSSDLFSLADRKKKIYSKKHVAMSHTVDFGMGVPIPDVSVNVPRPGGPHRPKANLAAMADRKLLEVFAPPGVIINKDLDVLHFRGQTGPYLEPAPGAASLNILRLARPELHVDLRRVIHEAQASNGTVCGESMVHVDGRSQQLTIEAMPIVDPETNATCLLVLFRARVEPTTDAVPVAAAAPVHEDQRIADLERDLLVTKEYLQSTIEELESANEELKSSNEELQSSNEEMQSTNEELETSKEELQSSNEELTTVNDELQSRMLELQQANDDLHNVLAGMGNAVVITGMDLRIRRYTYVAEKLFNLVATDIGRSVSQLNSFVKDERVEEMAKQVIERLAPLTREVRCADDCWYELNVSPYRTLDHQIKGTVISLTDVDIRRRATEAGSTFAGHSLGVINHPLVIIDRLQRVLWANDRFLAEFQVSAEATLGRLLHEIGAGQWKDPMLTALLEGTITTGSAFRDFKIAFDFPHIGKKTMRVSGSRIPPVGREAILVLLAFEEQLDG